MSFYTNKKVWITGASSGIGAATAKLLSEQGTELLLSARRTDALEEVRQACAKPDKVHILQTDIEQAEKQAPVWVAKAKELLEGSIDYFIANAGIGQSALAMETENAVERKLFEINYHGHLALSKAMLRLFLQQGHGQITAIGSIAGKFGQRKLAAYSASKAALIVYYESLRQEHKNDPVCLQVISPGFINTDVTINSLDAQGNKLNKNSPAQEKGMPADVFARKMLKAMRSKKFHHYIGGKELLAVPLHSLAPGLFYRLLG